MIHNSPVTACRFERKFDQYLSRENVEPKEINLPVGLLANTGKVNRKITTRDPWKKKSERPSFPRYQGEK